MFNKFIKRSSKFIAVLLAITLTFSPLSYAVEYSVDTWGGTGGFIDVLVNKSDATVLNITDTINRGTNPNGPYTQAATSLTIEGNGNTIDGNRESGYSGDLHRTIIVSTLTLDNVTIKSFSSNSMNYGGAITVNGSKIITLINSKFQDNISYSGSGSAGAIFNNGGKVIVGDGSEFLSNASFYRGGALYNKNNGNIEIGNEVKFISNFADPDLRNENAGKADAGGGAIYNETGKIIIGNDALFDSNIANMKMGGAIDSRATLTIGNDAIFQNNEAIYARHIYNTTKETIGGGKGGAIYNTSTLTIGTGARFEGNKATATIAVPDDINVSGGAIYNLGTTTIGNDARFENNTAIDKGGAIYNDNSKTLNIGNNAVFKGNKTTRDKNTNAGGAIYNLGTVTIGDGARFEENITYNALLPGGAIYNTSGKVVNIGTSTFVNNKTGEQLIDIYNVGNVNFKIETGQTGKTTMTGGITNYGDNTRGKTEIYDGVTLMVGYDEDENIVDGATFSQNQIIVRAGAGLITNASAVTITGTNDNGIQNKGILVFNGGTNANKITGEGSGTNMKGSLIIDGAVTNTAGTSITQSSITINSGSGKSFTVNADDVTLGKKTIKNEGTLNFTGGTNDDNITGDGKLTVEGTAGTVTNAENTTINQKEVEVTGTFINSNETAGAITATDSISIGTAGKITTNANAISVTDTENGITNLGTIEFTGGTNANKITGADGNLIIDGTLINESGTTISQK